MPKSSVMRFEISAETSHSLAGGESPVRNQSTVGTDSSSATQGSSMASVAGKNRAPTKQWANEAVNVTGTNKSASAQARKLPKLRDMTILHGRVTSHRRRRRWGGYRVTRRMEALAIDGISSAG